MERNDDPRTRYEITLDCGHTKTQSYPPLGPTAVIRCFDDAHPVEERPRAWNAYTDTLRGVCVVRTAPVRS